MTMARCPPLPPWSPILLHSTDCPASWGRSGRGNPRGTWGSGFLWGPGWEQREYEWGGVQQVGLASQAY